MLSSVAFEFLYEYDFQKFTDTIIGKGQKYSEAKLMPICHFLWKTKVTLDSKSLPCVHFLDKAICFWKPLTDWSKNDQSIGVHKVFDPIVYNISANKIK